MKVGVVAALVGAIVAELPVGGAGPCKRLLAGSYYGQTIPIRATLLMAALLALLMVGAEGLVQRLTRKRMGFRP